MRKKATASGLVALTGNAVESPMLKLLLALPATAVALSIERPEGATFALETPGGAVASCAYGTDCQRAATDCGFTVDCKRNYSVATINTSVPISAAEAARLHTEARAACASGSHSSVLETGGWCYDSVNAAGRTAGTSSFLIPEFHEYPDEGVLQLISKILTRTDGRVNSLLDLGAGVGVYGRVLLSQIPVLSYHGIDGAGNVEEFTGGFVRFADLSKPASLPRAEWAISLEVGEHINTKDESAFIANLHAHNCRGVILSWAVLGQAGHGHVNCNSNEYVTRLMEELGYRQNAQLTAQFKTQSKKWCASSTGTVASPQ